jgi:uncharacterized protein (TIGR04255 family)
LSEYTIFSNAPITEALLDIRVELSKDVDLHKLSSFHDFIKERFPKKQERVSFEAGFQMSPEGPTVLPTSKKPDGYLFRSSAENKIVQARLDGFTFNKLRPYENWREFRNEARELWEKYSEITKPVKITRIALRYINRIEIPLPLKDFKDYILTTPDIAPKLPQELEHFFMQLVVPMPDIPAKAIITQTMQNPTADVLPLIFDIDVYQEAIYSENQAEIWNVFEKLRNIKNEVFFNSITDKAKELFQ